MRHLIDPLDLTQREITQLPILPTVSAPTLLPIRRLPTTKKLATLFYEPPPAPACPLRRLC